MKPKIPVLLLVHRLHVGGAERDLAKLARYLDPKRFEAHVAAFHADGERRGELDQAGIPVLALPVRSLINRTAVDGALVLRKYVREHGIRIVQAFDAPTSIYIAPLGRILGIQTVTSHLYFRHLITGLQYPALRMVDVVSHKIVVNAHTIADHLVADYGVPRKRIFVSHNGVETNVFHPVVHTAREWRRERFGPGVETVIGGLCVMREEKRLDLLIESFAELREGLPEEKRSRIGLLLVGDGPMRERWEKLAASRGLAASCCQFVNTTGDVPKWFGQMDIYVLPSRSEGFPNSVLEAMACGVAVAASRVGGIPELIGDAAGQMFEEGNVEELTACLRRYVLDEEYRKAMAVAGAIRAREEFSMDRAAARMGAFYEQLVEAQR